MKTRIFILTSIIILTAFMGYSQDNLYFNRSLQDFASKMQISSGTPGYRAGDRDDSAVEGSEYFNGNFANGEIYTIEKEVFTDIPMRYNAYHGQIEIMMPDQTIRILGNTDNIERIVFDSSTYVYRSFAIGGKTIAGFLVLICNGKNQLFRRDYKVFMAGKPSDGIVNEIPPKIVDRPAEYYIDTGTGLPKNFRSSRELSDILGRNSQEINSFVKKEKINFKKEKDLVKLFLYIDSLN